MNSDIELEISRHGERGKYQVHVISSMAGGDQRELFELDVDALLSDRSRLESSILASSVEARRVTATSELPVRQVGQHRFETVMTRSVYGAYRASLGVAQQHGKRLRVVLRLVAPELAALPWEALFDPERQTYLCRQEPMVRRIPAQFNPRAALEVAPPLQVLAVVASPRGLPPLDTERERANLEEALSDLTAAGRVNVTWVEPATWRSIHQKLISGRWHIVHFIGHGDYDEQSEEGVLAFVGSDGRADMVEASRFADLLGEADPTPRLVVLNACSTGEAGAEDMLSATAPSLVHSGIEAVAAMQFAVSDDAAIAFAQGFYTAVAYSRGVDEAARSGRIAMLGAAGSLEWLTPVLYLRGDSTHPIVVVPAAEAEPSTPLPVAVKPPAAERKPRTPAEPAAEKNNERPAASPVPTQTRAALDATQVIPAQARTRPPSEPPRPVRPPPSPPAHDPPVDGSARRTGARKAVIGIAVAALLLAGFFVVRSFWSEEETPSKRAALAAGTALVTVQEPSYGQFRRLSTYDTSTGDLRPWAGSADEFDGGVTREDVDRFAATPSPDRTRVAYLEGEQEGLPVPHVAAADGSRDTLLMTSAKSPCENTKRPAWSPDGRQLAVVCVVPGPNPDDRGQLRFSIWIVDATDGEGIREVVDAQPLILGAPTWDAETNTLYSWQAKGPPPEDNLGTTGKPVQVSANRAHSQLRPITDRDGQIYSDGDWAPPGLLAVRRPAGAPASTDGEIVVINDDVVVVRQGRFVNASWSPDHETILATVNRDGGQKLLTLTQSGDVLGETGDLRSYGAPSWDTR